MTTETKKNEENKQEYKENESSAKSMATHTLANVKERAADAIDEKKSGITMGIKDVAGSIRKVAENLGESTEQNNVAKLTADYGNNFAKSLEKFSNYVDNTNIKEIARDVESFARRQPTLFVAGAFALGLIAARFLKTSKPLENFSLTVSKDESRNKANRKNYAHPQVEAQPV